MPNSNVMARTDAAKNHVGANMLVLDSNGDAGRVPFQGKVMSWLNINGTGTVAVRGSANLSSITDNGTGDYTANFSEALPDANYAPLAGCCGDGFYGAILRVTTSATGSPLLKSTTQCRFHVMANDTKVLIDVAELYVAFVR